MGLNLKTSNIIADCKTLKGNTKLTILFEPVWMVPFALYNFYLSLYMKSQGVTDKEIGFLISIGFLSGAVFSLFAGWITDSLGRKKTTFIFDLISWPGTILVYLFSNSFLMFAFAVIVNNTMKIVSVSWNLMLVEDADSYQRVAGYNILNIISMATGILTPVAGVAINMLGLVVAERVFFIISIISMIAATFIRNSMYTETKVGQQILAQHKRTSLMDVFKTNSFPRVLCNILKKPETMLILSVNILFTGYMQIGALNSLYFVPFMTEVLMIDKSKVSILGGIYSAVLLFVFVFVNPVINKYNRILNMKIGLLLQLASLFLLILIPQNSIPSAIIAVTILAFGFSIFKPFLDPILAEVTVESERAGVYSCSYTLLSVFTALIGFLCGLLYELNPRLIYVFSIIILAACIVCLTVFSTKHYKTDTQENSLPFS